MAPTATPVPARIDALVLFTDDLAARRAWYEGLGWTSPAPADAPFVPFPLVGSSLALWQRDAARPAILDAMTAQGLPSPAHAAVVQVDKPDDVERALAAAVAAGGRVVVGPSPAPFGGLSAWFADPQGNPWEIVCADDPTAVPLLSSPPDRGGDTGDGVVPRLSTVTLADPDVLARRAFYEDGLGWRCLTERRADIAQFPLATGAFSIWVEHEARAEVGDAVTSRGHRFSGLSIGIVVASAAEVDAQLDAFAARGADVVAAPTDQWWGGRSGHVVDPEGAPWEVVWIPTAAVRDGIAVLDPTAPA